MNFKFTLWKSIVSFLVFLLIFGFLLITINTASCTYLEVGGTCSHSTWYQNISYPTFWIVSLIVGLIVYVIWSLIQKGKKRK